MRGNRLVRSKMVFHVPGETVLIGVTLLLAGLLLLIRVIEVGRRAALMLYLVYLLLYLVV